MSAANMIARGLLDSNAVKISIDPPFTWTSGIHSPIYCDNRILISFPEIRELIVSEMMITLGPMKPEVIAGTATAGIPWASFVAYQMKLPMVYVRPEPKGHGAGKQIEGLLEPGKRVVLIEDLISTGGSSLKAAQVLRDEGRATVDHIVAIMTYGLKKASESLQAAEITLSTLTNFSTILEEVQSRGYLTETQINFVKDFAEDPASWWDNRST